MFWCKVFLAVQSLGQVADIPSYILQNVSEARQKSLQINDVNCGQTQRVLPLGELYFSEAYLKLYQTSTINLFL